MVVLFSCSKKEQQPDISQTILSLKESGELVTAEYTLSKVIRATDNKTWYKIGERKILINCEAFLKAGIDLQHISADNFRLYDDSIAVTLPHATFFSLSIPPEKIRIAYQEVGTFRDPFSGDEREKLVAQAEPQIRTLVKSLGILETAEHNGELFIKNLLQQAGFRAVTVAFQ